MQGLSHLLLLLSLTRGGDLPLRADPALAEFADGGGWSAHLDLLDELGDPERAEAAVLALALCEDAFVHVHLEALLLDHASGRALLGPLDRPVATRLRVAAAVALGINGHPNAFTALRRSLEPERSSVRPASRLEDAVLAGLSFSTFAVDRILWQDALNDGSRPRVRRHLGSGMALLVGTRPRSAGRLLARWTPFGGRIAHALIRGLAPLHR